jgi:hypothetical protein
MFAYGICAVYGVGFVRLTSACRVIEFGELSITLREPTLGAMLSCDPLVGAEAELARCPLQRGDCGAWPGLSRPAAERAD